MHKTAALHSRNFVQYAYKKTLDKSPDMLYNYRQKERQRASPRYSHSERIITMSTNSNLRLAKNLVDNEFYTRPEDIAKEL